MNLRIRPLDRSLQVRDSAKGSEFLLLSCRIAFDLPCAGPELKVDITGHYFRVPGFSPFADADRFFEHRDMSLPPRVINARISIGDPIVVDFSNNRPRSWLNRADSAAWALFGLVKRSDVLDPDHTRFGIVFEGAVGQPRIVLL